MEIEYIPSDEPTGWSPLPLRECSECGDLYVYDDDREDFGLCPSCRD